MKTTWVLSLILSLGSTVVFGDIIYPDGNAPTTEPYQLRKLARGVNNLVTAPFEIPKAVFDIGHEEGIMSASQFSLGLLRGPVRMFERVGSGFYDLFYWGDDDQNALMHMEPTYLTPTDMIPGFNSQFSWETIDTSGFHLNSPEIPSWR